MKPLARAGLVIVAMLASSTGSLAGQQQPMAAELGQPFKLKAGQSTQLVLGVAAVQGLQGTPPPGDTLRVGFDAVTADSRCPKGERCVWAGEATLRVWLQSGSSARQTRELKLRPGMPAAEQAVQVQGNELRLLSLDPAPSSGRTLAAQDYTATLSVSRDAPAAAAER